MLRSRSVARRFNSDSDGPGAGDFTRVGGRSAWAGNLVPAFVVLPRDFLICFSQHKRGNVESMLTGPLENRRATHEGITAEGGARPGPRGGEPSVIGIRCPVKPSWRWRC
jgi:hypothetical protein